ncbi:hypothetical protein I4U23_004616 [Adineta vaga]|nr:hypothetical protein I4U23_004616 [Adineta vaga]
MLHTNILSFSRKHSKIWILILFDILAGLLLATIIVLGVLYGNERKETTTTTMAKNDELCLTPYCIKAENIDETMDSCENFYEFACRKWIKNARIPDDANSQSTGREIGTKLNNIIGDLLSSKPLNEMVELKATINARRMYTSCVNEDVIEVEDVDVILTFINRELGGWPILQGST